MYMCTFRIEHTFVCILGHVHAIIGVIARTCVDVLDL